MERGGERSAVCNKFNLVVGVRDTRRLLGNKREGGTVCNKFNLVVETREMRRLLGNKRERIREFERRVDLGNRESSQTVWEYGE